MIADILKVITQNSAKEDRLTAQLQSQCDQLTTQIQEINEKVNQIQVNQILSIFSQHQIRQNINRNTANEIEHKLQIIQQFYSLCLVQQQQNKKLQLLNEELNHITELSQKYDLLGTIALKDFEPEQTNLTFIKQQIKDLSDQLTNWQNLQNVNKFHAQDGEVVQEYTQLVLFLDQFKKTAIQIYANLVFQTFKISKTNLVINKEYFHVVWTQEPSFTQSFIDSLLNFLDRFISYDINDRQYTIIVYQVDSNDSQLSLNQKSKIIFDSSQIILHYEHVITSLTNLDLFFTKLEQITLNQKKGNIQQVKRKTMQKTKQYFEYLLPYLKIEMRRNILSFFDVKSDKNQLSIYQLLVNLKIGGHDAEIMVSTIQQIIKKIGSNPQELKIIMKFIELAKSDKKSYSTILFVSDQLIEGLQQVEELNHEIVKGIRQLLLVREQMRMKIHEVEN